MDTIDLQRALPHSTFLFLGFDVAKYPQPTVQNERRGVLAGEVLFGMLSRLGLVGEKEGVLVFPLEPDRVNWI